MSERKIVWGPDEDTADYVTRVDTDDNDRVIVAETSDGTVLLEYDGDAEQWVYGGPVDMGGEDLDNVGAVDADSVTTGDLTVGNLNANAQLPLTDLADGDNADLLVPVPDGETLTVKLWGAMTDDGDAPTGLEVRLVDPDGSVLDSANQLRETDDSGIVSYNNDSGDTKVAILRLDNDTGDQQDAGAVFGYEVE